MSEKKLRLLLIAGYFPPVKISSGSIRPWNLSKYLTKLGWDISILTPHPVVWNPIHLKNNCQIEKEIEFYNLKMIYTKHKYRFLSPDRYRCSNTKLAWFIGGLFRKSTRFIGISNWHGWLECAFRACDFLTPTDVDVIVATGGPFVGFQVAYRLAQRIKKPYVLDYRDLWTNNPWHPNNKKWVTNQERKLVLNSSRITVVSPSIGIYLNSKYGVGLKTNTITNGYDASEMTKINPATFNHFSIIYAGSLIPPIRTLFPLFLALKRINDDISIKEKCFFHYFGPNSDLVIEDIKQLGIEEICIVHNNKPRLRVLSLLKGANLVVIITSSSENNSLQYKGVITGKIFEAIGLGVPILVIAPKGSDVEAIVAEAGNGRCFSPTQIDEIADFIKKCMRGEKLPLGKPEKYSWEELSKKFDRLFKELIEKN